MKSQDLTTLNNLIGNKLSEQQKEEFKKALIEAMNGRTQIQFAADSGISRSQISRLLNGDYTTPPSNETLEKIADHAAGRVNMAKLKGALGLTILDKDSEDNFEELSYSRRNAVQAEELRRGLTELTNKPIKHGTVEEILETLIMLYSRDTTKYQVDEIFSLNDEDEKKHKGAEEACNVLLRWENRESYVDYGCTIFYCKTQKGGIIVNDLAFDLKTLYECKNRVAIEIKDGLVTGEEEINPDDNSLSYITVVKNDPNAFVKQENKDKDNAKILSSLYAVAGDEERKVLDILCERIREFES